jgi:subtilisin family serine protease
MTSNLRIFFFLLLVSGFAVPSGLQAQTQRQDYHDGKLYVKLFNHQTLAFPSINGAEEIEKLQQNFPEVLDLAREHGLTYLHKAFNTRSEDLDHTYEFRFSNMAGIDRFMRTLNQLSYIDYAEKVPTAYPDFVPNDYNSFTDYHITRINALGAWDITQGDTNVVIAVVDDAVNITHPDLAANIWINRKEIPGNGIDDDNNGYIDDINGWDAADNDNDPNPHPTATDCNVSGTYSYCHGSSVAGAASAVTNNGIGAVGAGFNCRIMAVKAKTNSNPGGLLDSTWPGVDYAISADADVVNMSFGGASFSQTIQNLINAGHAKGIVFVTSAGNDGVTTTVYPSGYNHVISVGATNSTDAKAGFSNYGPFTDVMAPGVNIRTTAAGSPSYVQIDGTSFSCPITSGVIGLMLSVNPCLTPDDVEFYLESTCDNIDAQNAAFVGQIGAGRINAASAVMAVMPQNAPQANFTVVNTNSCGGDVQFMYSTTDPIASCPSNFFWSFGNGQISTEANPVATFTTSGTYTVTLTVFNSAGTNQVTVNVPVTVLPNPVVTSGPDVTACFGDEVQLNGSSNLPGTFSWSPTIDLSNPNVANPTLTANASRTYFVTVTTPDGCSDTDMLVVAVLPSPSVWAGLDKTINPGDSTQLGALGALTYEWSPAMWLSDPNSANPVAKPLQTITYTAKGFNNEGCSDEDEVKVTVNGTWHVGIADDFEANAGTVFPLFPNPAGESVQFGAMLNKGGDLRIFLSDLSGRQIARIWEGSAASGSFDYQWQRPSGIAAGMYLAVWELNGARFTQKIQLKD